MRVVFIGTGEIGVPTLRRLLESQDHQVVAVVTQPDKPVGRSQRIESPPIKKIVADSAIQVLQPARIKEPAVLEKITRLAPDLILVMAYGQILPPPLLVAAPFGCLNVHASLLPRWRGAAPIQAAIAAGDRETGLTIMYMDEGLDTGDMLLQRKIEITAAETGGRLHDRLAEIAPEPTLESLQLLAAGAAPRIKQDNNAATYAPKLTRESGKIDWSEPAVVIERKIRAFDPWPGAFMLIPEKSGKLSKLKVYHASVVDGSAQPGNLISNGGDKLIVATGESALSLEEVQLEGKRRMPISEFLRGRRS